MSPAEQALRADLDGTKVQIGVERGRWNIIRLEWPHLYVAFPARPVPGGAAEYLMQFDCSRYRGAVRGVFWDDEASTELNPSRWPRLEGDEAFKVGWQPCGRTALYVACDGDTQQNKPQWKSEHSLEWWGPTSDITLYFGVIHVRLHSSRYRGNGGTTGAAVHQ